MTVIFEAITTKIFLAKLLALNHRSHAAVDDHQSARENLSKGFHTWTYWKVSHNVRYTAEMTDFVCPGTIPKSSRVLKGEKLRDSVNK